MFECLKEKFELSNPQKVSATYVTTPTVTTPTLATPTCQPDTGTVENGLMEIDLGSSECNDVAQIDIDHFSPEAPEVNHLQLAESNDRGPSPLDLQDNIGFEEFDSKGIIELDATLVPDEATELEKGTNSSTSLILDTQFITDQSRQRHKYLHFPSHQELKFPPVLIPFQDFPVPIPLNQTLESLLVPVWIPVPKSLTSNQKVWKRRPLVQKYNQISREINRI